MGINSSHSHQAAPAADGSANRCNWSRLALTVAAIAIASLSIVAASPALPAHASFPLDENFDSVAWPNLPAGWTHDITGIAGDPAWRIETGFADTPANSIHAFGEPHVTDNTLTSPGFTVASPNTTVTFRHNYGAEVGRDGGVLEISVPTINAGAFTDIVAAGGSFTLNGYTGSIDLNHGSLIAGRPAWTGASNGWITSTAKLPAAATGQNNVALRWRYATDDAVGGTGWSVDTVSLSGLGGGALLISDTAIISDLSAPTAAGQPYTVAFIVTGPGGIPSGMVTVSDGTGQTCTATVAIGSCSLTSVTGGLKDVTAGYAGDQTFAPSLSAPVSHLVVGVPQPEKMLLALSKSVSGSAAGPNVKASLGTYLKSATAYLAMKTNIGKMLACQQLTNFESAVTIAATYDPAVAAQTASWKAAAEAIKAAIPC